MFLINRKRLNESNDDAASLEITDKTVVRESIKCFCVFAQEIKAQELNEEESFGDKMKKFGKATWEKTKQYGNATKKYLGNKASKFANHWKEGNSIARLDFSTTNGKAYIFTYNAVKKTWFLMYGKHGTLGFNTDANPGQEEIYSFAKSDLCKNFVIKCLEYLTAALGNPQLIGAVVNAVKQYSEKNGKMLEEIASDLKTYIADMKKAGISEAKMFNGSLTAMKLAKPKASSSKKSIPKKTSKK